MNKNMMRQVQKLQGEMQRAREELGETVVEGTAGGGVVSIVVDGNQHLRSVKISPDVVDPGDVEMLEDLMASAIRDALTKAQKLASDRLGNLTGGLGIPGL